MEISRLNFNFVFYVSVLVLFTDYEDVQKETNLTLLKKKYQQRVTRYNFVFMDTFPLK